MADDERRRIQQLCVNWCVKCRDIAYASDCFAGDWMRNSRPDLESVIDAGVSLRVQGVLFSGY